MRYNEITTKDYRIDILQKGQFSYFDLIVNPSWQGHVFQVNRNISIDGAPYKYTNQKLIFGTYFFLADEYVTHSRDAENILGVLAKFGGLFSLAINLLAVPGKFSNKRLLFSKFIRTLFLSKNGKEVKRINFSFMDSFSDLR